MPLTLNLASTLALALTLTLALTPTLTPPKACDYPRATAVVGGGLSYAVAATPVVTLVSPRRGSTAGGTALTLTVSNLPDSLLASHLRASVAGVAAAVDSIAYSGGVATVGVTTGAHGRTSVARPGVGGFELTTIASVGHLHRSSLL